MTKQPEPPRWELLPHDAVGFFELADGFDRRDLKRAYNRLLRQFKPEKFPAEFQRIRAAFEELDEELRYHGGAATARTPVPQDWKTDVESPPTTTPQAEIGQRDHSRVAQKRLVDRIAEESPAELFNELRDRSNKSPYDFYALALLSDIVEKSATGFAKWLIAGIAAHRQDGALKQLLHDALRGPQSGAALLKLLPLAARAIRTDEFYPLTEPAWQVVLRECSFEQFATVFDRCEAELRDSHIVGRMAFLIQVLKTALWLDPAADGWSARQFRFVEENFGSIPPWLEWDVEILGLAREYLEVRQQFAVGSPLRTKMDAALKDYFCEPQEVGDRSIVAAQMEILASGDALIIEFPMEEGELVSKFYPIWAWASHDVAERQSIAPEEPDVNENVWASRAAALLERLEKECNNSLTGVMWSLSLVARIVVLIVLGVVFLMVGLLLGSLIFLPLESFFGEDGADTGIILAAVLAGIGALVGPWVLKGTLDRRIWFPLNGKFATTCYRASWRRELMDFQRRSHVPDGLFRALFAHLADKSATATWVNQFVQLDYAPALLAGAQRYEA